MVVSLYTSHCFFFWLLSHIIFLGAPHHCSEKFDSCLTLLFCITSFVKLYAHIVSHNDILGAISWVKLWIRHGEGLKIENQNLSDFNFTPLKINEWHNDRLENPTFFNRIHTWTHSFKRCDFPASHAGCFHQISSWPQWEAAALLHA